MGFRLAAVLLLAASTLASAQTLYRWVDKDGRVHYADQPPPQDARRVQEKRIGSGNFVETSTPSYALSKAQQEFPVTLYTAPDCAAACKTAREFLARRGVSFAETALKTEQDVAQFRQTFGGGEVVVPAISVGSQQKQRGFEDGAWSHILDEAGYPRSGIPGNAARAPAQPAPAAQ